MHTGLQRVNKPASQGRTSDSYTIDILKFELENGAIKLQLTCDVCSEEKWKCSWPPVVALANLHYVQVSAVAANARVWESM